MAQSWKKFGGIKQFDALNHLTVNSLTTDDLALRNPYNGTFAISGELFVYDNAQFQKNVDVCNNVYVDDNVFIRDYLVMGPQYERGSAYSDFYTRENATNYSHFFHADTSGVGLNVHSPQAIMDISGSHGHILHVYSASESTRNVLVQNKDGNHIALEVDASYARIVFSHSDVSTSILYEPTLDQLRLPEQVVLGQYPREGTASLILDENGRNTTSYWVSVDDVSLCAPLQVRSRDLSTNATVFLSNSDQKGWYMGGGTFPVDGTKQMGFMGWMDASGQFIPSQIQTSNDSLREIKTSTGFNTYNPSTTHALDVNGPLQLKHQEIMQTARSTTPLHSVSFSKSNPNFGMATGNAYQVDTVNNVAYHHVYRTTNGGHTWQVIDLSYDILKYSSSAIQSSLETTLGVHVFGDSSAVLSAKAHEDLHLIQTSDQGTTWDISYIDLDVSGFFSTIQTASTLMPFAIQEDATKIVFLETDISVNRLVMLDNGVRYQSVHDTDSTAVIDNLQFQSIDGTDTFLYAVDTSGNITRHEYTSGTGLEFSQSSLLHRANRAYAFITVSGDNYKLAVGNNLITTEIGNDGNYIDISFNESPSFRHAVVYDISHALAVGDNGVMYYTRENIADATTWKAVPDTWINGMGNSSMLREANLIHVHAIDVSGHFAFTCEMASGTRFVYAYFPDLWFPDTSPPILSIEGHLETHRETIKIFENNVQTVYIGSNATDVYLDMSGTTHMNTARVTDSHHTNVYTDELKISTAGSGGLTLDGIETQPIIKPNDLSKTIQVDLSTVTLADTSNTLLVDGNLRIGGNLWLDGSTNVIENFNIVFNDGKSKDLVGTEQPELHVNYNNPDIYDASLSGAGFYISNDRLSAGSANPSTPHHGFMKVSNEAIDKLSFRSIGHQNVVAMDFSNIQTYTSNKNTLLVLKQNQMPTELSDISDNFYIRSTHCDNTTIDVSAAMDNIFDLSVNRNVDVYGSQHIHQTLTVDGDASFNTNVTISGDLYLNNNLRDGGNYRSSRIAFQSYANDEDYAKLEYYDSTQDISALHYNGAFDVTDTSNSCLVVRTKNHSNDNMIIHSSGNMVIDTGLYDAGEPSSSTRTSSGNIYLLPFSNKSGTIGMGINDELDIGTDVILDVSGNVKFQHNLLIKGDLTLEGTSSVQSNVQFQGDIIGEKDAIISGELSLGGDASFNSNVTVSGDILLNNNSKGNYSSSQIKLQSNQEPNDYARIEYFDNSGQLSSLNYRSDFVNSNNNNSILLIETAGDGNNDTGKDNMIIRAAANLVLDTGVYGDSIVPSNTHNNRGQGGDLLLMPVGGHIGIGRNDPSVELDVSGDVSFNGHLYVRHPVGFGMQPDSNFALSVFDDVSFHSRLYVHSDVSLMTNVFMANGNGNNVGIGMQPVSNYKLSVNGDVSMSDHLDVYGDVSMHETVRIGHYLGVGREPSRNEASADIYTVEISGNYKGLHIYENGEGTYGSSSGGTITLEHGTSGGYNSIIFKNKMSSWNYGAITYVDDASSSPVDLSYSNILKSGNANGTLAIFSRTDPGVNNTDNIVIRPSGQLILDTGDTADGAGLDVVILPNGGGNVGIGTINPTVQLDLSGDAEFSGTFYVGKQAGIGMSSEPNFSLSVSGDVSFNNHLYVYGQTYIRQDVSMDSDLFVSGDASFNSNVDITGNVNINGDETTIEGNVTIKRDTSIEGNLTVTQHLHIMGNTTTIDSEVTTIKDPLILLGDISGVDVPDTWDRGILFKHTVNNNEVTGFMGFDKHNPVLDSSGVFRFRMAGSNILDNNVGDIVDNQDTINQEGTLLARTYKTTNAANTVKLLLNDPYNNGATYQWCGVTTRTNAQIYNVDSHLFKHAFTYGESYTGTGGTGTGSSSSFSTGTTMGHFDASGLFVFGDISGRDNLYIGESIEEIGKFDTPKFQYYKADTLIQPVPYYISEIDYTPAASDSSGGALTVYGTNESSTVDTIAQIPLGTSSETFHIYSTELHTDISFVIQLNDASEKIGTFVFRGYRHKSQTKGPSIIEGSARIKRQLYVDDRIGVGRLPTHNATMALEDVSNTILLRTYVRDPTFNENALVEKGDSALCWYDVSKNPSNHFVLHPWMDNGGLTMDGSGNVGIHTRTTAGGNYALSVLGNMNVSGQMIATQDVSFMSDVDIEGTTRFYNDTTIYAKYYFANIFDGVTMNQDGEKYNTFTGETYRNGTYKISDYTFFEKAITGTSYNLYSKDAATDYYDVSFQFPFSFRPTTLSLYTSTITGQGNRIPLQVEFYGIQNGSRNELGKKIGIESNGNGGYEDISLPFTGTESYDNFLVRIKKENNVNIYINLGAFELGGHIIYERFSVDMNDIMIQHAKFIANRDTSNILIGSNVSDNGINNTALGFGAMENASIAGSNTAIGANTLTNFQGGSYQNTAVGTTALTALTSSSPQNVAIGSDTMKIATSNNSYNTALGARSLEELSSNCTRNTAVGHLSGQYLDASDSSSNTFLGSSTRVKTSTTSYSYSTALGYAATIDASNQIVLGRSQEYVYIPSTRESTSKSTGALVVDGGVGVSGDIHFGTTSGEVQFGNNSNGLMTLTEDIGTYGNSNGGTLTLVHNNPGGASSIVFKSKQVTDNYGILTYIDDYDTSTYDDINYEALDTGSGHNSVLLISTENNTDPDSGGEHIVIRPSSHLILDTNNEGNSPNPNSAIIMIPNGGNCVIGKPNVEDIGNVFEISGNSDLKGLFTVNDATLDVSNTSMFFGDLSATPTDFDRNTAFGYNALSGVNSNRNTAFGHEALYGGVTGGVDGGMNTAVGNYSSRILTSSTKNVSVGHNSLKYANVNSNQNTCIGADTFERITTNSSENTCIGFSIGGRLSDGSYNSFFGAETDVDSNTESYSYSTALGYGATIDASNQIVLGRSQEYVYIPSTTASDSSTTGALVVSGGAGIGGNLNVANNIVMENGTLTITEDGEGSAGNESDNAVGTITLKHTTSMTGCNSIVFQSKQSSQDNARIVFYDDLHLQSRDDISYSFITGVSSNNSCLLIQNNKNGGISNPGEDSIIIRSRGHLVLDTGYSTTTRVHSDGTPGDIYALPNGGSFIIGSGTTSTSYTLDVSGDVSIAGDVSMSGVITINPGNLGVGTTSPATKLHIHQQHDNDNNGNFPAGSLRFSTDNGNDYWDVGEIESYIKAGTGGSSSSYPGGLAFKTKPADGNYADGNYDTNSALTTKMVIDANGNVGIGTTLPSHTLDVSGDLNVTSDVSANLYKAANTAGMRYTFEGDTNTGINYISSNSFSLDASGRKILEISEYTVNTNIYFGDYALENWSSGGHNMAFGTYALHEQTTGLKNVAFGHRALDAIRDGSNNTGIGYYAGRDEIQGKDLSGNSSFNTCIGMYTGPSTTGEYNCSTAIGYGAKFDASNQIVLGTSDEEVYIPGNLVIKKSSYGNGPSSEGSLIFEHDISNASSIIFKSAHNSTSDYAFIRYVDDWKDLSLGSRYDSVSGDIFGISSSDENSVLFIGTENDESENHSDNMLIRPTGVLTLDTGGSNDATDNNNIILFPNSNASGNVGIKTASPGYDLDVDGTFRCTSGATAASFNATSDYRVKENVQTISNDNYTVDHLRPVSYTLKESQEPHIGFIAHELQEHVPTAVTGEKDGEEMQSVNYSELIPILVKEIQDLKQKVSSLESEVDLLRNPPVTL